MAYPPNTWIVTWLTIVTALAAVYVVGRLAFVALRLAAKKGLIQFTLRDLLWLTVVVAMGFGWWREYKRGQDLRDEQEQRMEAVRRHLMDSMQ